MSTARQMIDIAKSTLFAVSPSRFPQYAIYSHRVGIFSKGNIRLKLDMRSGGHHYVLSNDFERDLSRVLWKVPKPGDLVVDIGAHVGWHSVNVLVNRPDVSKVLSYEPYPCSRQYLEYNIGLNGVKERCRINPKAVGDVVGKAALRVFKNMNEMHNSLYSLGDAPFDEIEIEITTLDREFSDGQLWPSVIKCDVEGHEMSVLRGALGLLTGSRGVPLIWFLEANYETAAMAGYFPWELIDAAKAYSPYEGYYIRDGAIKILPDRKSLRHGDTLILAIPHTHSHHLKQASQ